MLDFVVYGAFPGDPPDPFLDLELPAGPPKERLMALIEEEPGLSGNQLCLRLAIRRPDGLRYLRELHRENRAYWQGGKRGAHHWFPYEPGTSYAERLLGSAGTSPGRATAQA